jgi:hypothetical protein
MVTSFLVIPVCNMVFDISPTPLSALEPMIGTGMAVVELCYSGVTLFQMIPYLNLPGFDPAMLNFTNIAATQINSFDFSAVSNFDLRYYPH